MGIPDFQTIMLLFLRCSKPIEMQLTEMIEQLAEEFGLTSEVVTRAGRTGRLNATDASAALASFDLLAARSRPLRHGPADFESAEKLVRHSTAKMAAPDALHLESAKNAGAALATFDARLADATRAQALEVAGLV